MSKEIQVAYAEELKYYIDQLRPQDEARWPQDCHLDHLFGMCLRLEENHSSMSETKCARWVGYIQGVLVARGLSTVERERRAYKACKLAILSVKGVALDSPVSKPML